MKFTNLVVLAVVATVSASSTCVSPVMTEPFKAAIVMPGSITDQAWNQAGYEAIMRAKEELGIEVAYSEKVAQPDQVEAMADYARRGYDVVLGHGGEFVDAAVRAAQNHPDTLFVVTNGFVSGSNVASLSFNFKQFGYVLGYLGGKMSRTGKAGWISAQKIKVTTDLGAGFAEGFRKVWPEAKVFVAYTNDWDDVAKAKEAALNQINQGADVIFPTLDNATIGALQACREKGVWSVGLWQDIYDAWPETVLQSAVMDFRVAIVDFLRIAMEGKVEGGVYTNGIGSEAGVLGKYNPAIPESVKAEVEAIISDLVSGKLKL